MNTFELSRRFFDFSFENKECKAAHAGLFYWIIELNNRLGWKEEFGLPTHDTMEGLSIGNKNTYYSLLRDLEKWGFIKMIKLAKNQFQACIISICRVKSEPAPYTAPYTALDTALIQHHTQHCHSTIHSTVPIDKPLNNKTNKQVNNKTIDDVEFDFSEEEKENKISVKKTKDLISENFEKILEHWNICMEQNSRPTISKKTQFKERSKNFKIEEIANAIQNLSKSSWHRGDNSRGWIADWDFLFRKDEQIEKFLNQTNFVKKSAIG